MATSAVDTARDSDVGGPLVISETRDGHAQAETQARSQVPIKLEIGDSSDEFPEDGAAGLEAPEGASQCDLDPNGVLGQKMLACAKKMVWGGHPEPQDDMPPPALKEVCGGHPTPKDDMAPPAKKEAWEGHPTPQSHDELDGSPLPRSHKRRRSGDLPSSDELPLSSHYPKKSRRERDWGGALAEFLYEHRQTAWGKTAWNNLHNDKSLYDWARMRGQC